MERFVGTSGWYYPWNEEKSLDWYIKNSGLNAVELNASFYRFPFPNQVKSWSTKGKNIRWSVKVNRLITHVHKFNKKALDIWKSFERLFSPLDKNIDFYLFQLPPSMKPTLATKIKSFIQKTKLRERACIEFRNMEWFDKKWVDWASELKMTVASVDSPDFPREILNSNNIVYVRMHGRSSWYSHDYSDEELKEVRKKILKAKAGKVYVFFNNNTNMLRNAQRMLSLFK